MPQNPQQTLFQIVKSDPKYNPHNSYLWFQTKVKELFGNKVITSQQVMAQSRALMTNTIWPGRMYTYVYDPKTKDKLPYYDTFPLVLPFDKNNHSFIGLNLHYLDYKLRLFLLNKLMTFAVHNKQGEVNYLRWSWSMLSQASRFMEIRPCIKRYLFSHVHSKFIMIPPEDWAVASMLPTENFQKAKLTAVWKDSQTKINSFRRLPSGR